jgi:hypothetical protein
VIRFSPPALARLAMPAALVMALPACGKRGDPLPPLRRIPQPVMNLRLAQRGDKLEIAYVVPRNSTDGARLPVLEVEVLQMDGEGDFQKQARHRRRKAAPGEVLLDREPLPSPGTPVRVAVRAIANGKASVLTPPASLTVKTPPPAPSNLEATLTPEGVTLAWEGDLPAPPVVSPETTPAATPPSAPASPAASTPEAPAPAPTAPNPAPPSPATAPSTSTAQAPPPAAPSPPPAAPSTQTPPANPPLSPPAAKPTPPPAPPFRGGFWVYRRGGAGEFTRPLFPEPVEARRYVDSSAPAGEQWCYVVRTVLSVDPVIESASSDEACVDVKDITAPAAPFGLTAVLRGGAVELTWSPSTEPDLKLYRVYRAPARGPAVRIAEVPSGETTCVDRPGTEGALYRYTVTAVDTAGNESAPSNPAEARTP